jgi:hypothetical protein
VSVIQVDPKYGWVLKRWRWEVYEDGYARAWIDGGNAKLHSYLWKLEFRRTPRMIDHINEDKADCRICNLRPANKRLNTINTSHRRKASNLPRGVTFNESCRRPFVAAIRGYGHRKHLGCFFTAEEASRAYEEARQMVIEFESLKASV